MFTILKGEKLSSLLNERANVCNEVSEHYLNCWLCARQVDGAGAEVVVDEGALKDYVGQPPFSSDRIYSSTPVGVVMGLAWCATPFLFGVSTPSLAGGDLHLHHPDTSPAGGTCLRTAILYGCMLMCRLPSALNSCVALAGRPWAATHCTSRRRASIGQRGRPSWLPQVQPLLHRPSAMLHR